MECMQIYVKKNFTYILKSMYLHERHVRLLLHYLFKVVGFLLGQIITILTSIAFQQMRF